ncbi:MAG: transporter substrate-binding domain-containing protein, partial [Kangiellaceae bacterium]|nr:transporter substrate-binding domain-containing protein [Kangiellaceae bacterium]
MSELAKLTFNFLGAILPNLAVKISKIAALLGVLVSLAACQEASLTELEQIKRSGILKIATRNSPTTYYVEKDGPAGIEYDLATEFANYLGVTPVFVAKDSISEIFDSLDSGSADLAAAGLTVTEERRNNYTFGPPYQETSAKLVFKQGKPWPRSFAQINGLLKIVASSSHSGMLLDVKQDFPQLSWRETQEHSPEELLDMVLDETIDYTITDSVELDLNRRYKTELAIAFTVGEPQQLSWALPKSDDHSLLSEMIKFFGSMRQQGKIAQLIEHYYGHVEQFDYVGAKTFIKAAQTDLEEYTPLFKQAAGEDIDWRLLAALGYQESH